MRIRAGDNKQVAVLQIPKVDASVTVGRDRQEAAADPRMSTVRDMRKIDIGMNLQF